jgi:hypothetical protein
VSCSAVGKGAGGLRLAVAGLFTKEESHSRSPCGKPCELNRTHSPKGRIVIS